MIGTPLQGTKLDPREWMAVASIIVERRRPLSVRQIARDTGVRPATIWGIRRKLKELDATSDPQLSFVHALIRQAQRDEEERAILRRQP